MKQNKVLFLWYAVGKYRHHIDMQPPCLKLVLKTVSTVEEVSDVGIANFCDIPSSTVIQREFEKLWKFILICLGRF